MRSQQVVKINTNAYTAAAAMTFLCLAAAVFPKEVSDAVAAAAYRCINVIIPSLFAFMAFSGIILNSRIYTYISKPFYPISQYLLKMPNSLFFVFLMGNAAGYPVGISLLSDLVRQGRIEKKTACAMSCYCYAGGPAFLTSAVGLTLFGSARTGMIIFLSILTSNLVIAAVINRIVPIRERSAVSGVRLSGEILTDSVENAGRSLFRMCCMILFFAALLAILSASGVYGILTAAAGVKIKAVCRAMLEITEITAFPSPLAADIPLIAAVCGFGGLCVILQVFSVCRGTFSLKPFLLTRPLCFGVQYAAAKVFARLFREDHLQAFSINRRATVNFNNFIPSLCLIIMIFIIVFRKKLAISQEL